MSYRAPVFGMGVVPRYVAGLEPGKAEGLHGDLGEAALAGRVAATQLGAETRLPACPGLAAVVRSSPDASTDARPALAG